MNLICYKVQSSKSNSDVDSGSERCRIVSQEFDMLLAEVRNIPKFERFLLGPSESELKASAAQGPIVLFNVSELRSDAFLVQKDSIRSIPLPLLKYSELETYTTNFINAPRTHLRANREVKKVLEWLWDAAVGPILEELGFIKTPGEGELWPRVWWVPCGLLSLLPIHAAGHHDIETSNPETAIDRIISSYTPTIKVMDYARERRAGTSGQRFQKAVIVGMPETPDHETLPFVTKEIQGLNMLLSPASRMQITSIKRPTRSNVLSMLRDCQIAHFSCHGYSDSKDPSQSKLLLNDWRTSPLTVSDLTALNIRSSELAFLSACHTASGRNISLLDESINLSTAVQLAGYPSVIGTLWQV